MEETHWRGCKVWISVKVQFVYPTGKSPGTLMPALAPPEQLHWKVHQHSPGHIGRQSDGRECSPYVRERQIWGPWVEMPSDRVWVLPEKLSRSSCRLIQPPIALPITCHWHYRQVTCARSPWHMTLGLGSPALKKEGEQAKAQAGNVDPFLGVLMPELQNQTSAIQNSVTIFSVSSLQRDIQGSVGCGNIIHWGQSIHTAAEQGS